MSIDNASRLAMALQAGLEIPPDVRQWLLSGLRGYLEQGHTLDGALGLQTEPGGHFKRPHVAATLAQRDNYLRALAYWLDNEAAPWQAAGEVKALIQGYQASGQHGLAHGHPAEVLLPRLNECDLSQKQIYRVLRGDRSC